MLRSLIINVPPVTRTLTTATLAISAFAFLLRYRAAAAEDPDTLAQTLPIIALMPGYALWTPWTFATATFYESNAFVLIVHSITTLLCGKYMERAWGGREFLKFVAVVSVLSNLIASALATLVYYVTNDEYYLYQIQFSGMAAMTSAYLVAFKQFVPEHLVSFFQGILAIRVKQFPLLFLTVYQALPIFFPSTLAPCLLAHFGWFVSWAYIRFFKVQDGIRGDRSETFSMASFFPEFLQPLVKVISNITFHTLVFLRCCRPIPKHYGAFDIENQTANRVPGPLPGSARAEAERRRALALKALDMRLSKHASPPQTPPPRANLPVTIPTTSDPNFETTQSESFNPVSFDAANEPETATIFDGNTENLSVETKERTEAKRD